jgi:hypothetical protein
VEKLVSWPNPVTGHPSQPQAEGCKVIIKQPLKAGNKKTNPTKFGINGPLSNKYPI